MLPVLEGGQWAPLRTLVSARGSPVRLQRKRQTTARSSGASGLSDAEHGEILNLSWEALDDNAH